MTRVTAVYVATVVVMAGLGMFFLTFGFLAIWFIALIGVVLIARQLRRPRA